MEQIRPLFISPLVYNERIVNARINSALISSLPTYFSPVVLCGDATPFQDCTHILNVKYSLVDKIRLNYLHKVKQKEIHFLPDLYYYYWYKKALRIAEEYINKNKIDYIHSFSYPYTSHLVALELKKKFNIPWIAHFYEPWGDNLFRMINQKVITSNITWENDVANAADLIIHNSETMCDSWRKRYCEIAQLSKKILYLPMTFEFKAYPSEENKLFRRDSKRKLQITHVGNFYGLRKARPFLLAVNELIKEIPHIKERINITLVGDVLQEDINYAKNHDFLDIIDIVGRKTEEECVSYYQKSDLFLVIESEQQGSLFFPSKLIQYYYYNRPILGITTDHSVLFDELKANGHNAFNPSNTEGIKNYLKIALYNYNSILDYNKDAWKRFDSKNVKNDYLTILNSVLKII